MAKFSGKVGFLSTTETAPGVYSESITEKTYRVEIIRNRRNFQQTDQLNDNITLNNLFSIICDFFAIENAHSIRYVKWNGVLWKVTNIEIQRPRIIITVGGVYNGPLQD